MRYTLWTLQHREAYEQFRRTGLLRADERFIESFWLESYDWLASQMRSRLGGPPDGVRYPVWAWYQWEGRKKRCDLRCAGYAPRGTQMVQIEFDVDSSEVLLSDFDLWHAVLNKSYLAVDEPDFDAFYACTHNDRQQRLETSWNRIFDLQHRTPGWDGPLETMTVQATLWEIRSDQIKKVEFFTAK